MTTRGKALSLVAFGQVKVKKMADTENIEVTVKTLDSQSRTYTVNSEVTVKEFKEHISGSVGISAEKQRLIYQGRVLQDDKKLKEYNVHGKVIHLVERAPPQTLPQTGGTSEARTSASQSGGTRASGTTAHDGNANSYVMVGTFNLPLNIMDPQQIQQSVQQVMTNLGETGRNARVTTTTGSDGSSVDVHINMEQTPVQSEPRVRLVLAQHMLRDIQGILSRLEGQTNGQQQENSESSQSPTASSSSATEAEGGESMDVSHPATQPAIAITASITSSVERTRTTEGEASSSSSDATQTEGTQSGPNHPSPREYLDVLTELQRVESRLQPFIQRYQDILSTASTADYNNNTESREEDQRLINLVGEALRLLGNTFVALSDLRCNLSSATPRHLHVVRPMSHYASPVVLQQAAIPIQINVGTTVTMTANGGRFAHTAGTETETTPTQQSQTSTLGETQSRPPEGQAQTQSQTVPPVIPQVSQTGHPRMIRITHQTVEPVVMMQMNIQDSTLHSSGTGSNTSAGTGQGAGGVPPVQIPGLPPEFLQAIMHQISQQAMTAAAATNSSASQVPGFQPQPARVVITRPPPPGARHPGGSTQPGVQTGAGPNASLAQMISGLVGQLLMQPVVVAQGGSTTASTSATATSTSSSTASPITTTAATTAATTTTGTTTSSTTPTSGPAPEVPHSVPTDAQFSQLLGNILGAATSGIASVAAPTITVAMPAVPAFIQGMNEFLQATQGAAGHQVNTQSTQEHAEAQTPLQTDTHAGGEREESRPPGSGATSDSLTPEFFTSVVQGVLSSVMGTLNAQQGSTESIASFIQRLSGASSIFEPGSSGALGFFGDLLLLICQNFSLVDMVMLLHGQFQPLQRIQPQLNRFFQEQYLNNREPTEQNIRNATNNLINGLEDYIRESFAFANVRDGVNITRTNLDFLRELFNRIASHILHCTDSTFGLGLLELCNRGLFECLALNLYCLRGEQNELMSVINERIRLMSVDVNPTLVNWLTTVMGIRLRVILEHMPVTEQQILHYVRRESEQQQDVQDEPMDEQPAEQEPEEMQRDNASASPTPATTAEEVMASVEQPTSMDLDRVQRDEPDVEPWAAAVPPEWVPIIRQDIQTQRKMKPQGPFSDAYLNGMPAKRRKKMQSDGLQLSLTEAVNKAARTVGVKPVTSAEGLNSDLERPVVQETYRQQVKLDIQKKIKEDPDYSAQRFPNTHRVFEQNS
ncbi:large proline-rich protein BAG6 isoform X2 [Protopterus annectens]|uniref:large proline-rich protein BAG6 isoform X2 n=1 Tax=Protopterus annectens TaxID=7888 RepID=UPI001CF9E594|nr:large proline-rich protein BAG6 isoform X2 [Protopterus annectens]